MPSKKAQAKGQIVLCLECFDEINGLQLEAKGFSGKTAANGKMVALYRCRSAAGGFLILVYRTTGAA
jgi:hypothetical protein